MALIPIEEEDDDLEDDDFEIETLDDGDDDLSEPGENMNWPTAVVYVAFFLAFIVAWHDCLGHR